MERYEIMAFWGHETNPFANLEKANNGGGYSQPCGGASVLLRSGKYLIVNYYDYSCGDFGTRKEISFEIDDIIYSAIYGTMDDIGGFRDRYELFAYLSWELRLDIAELVEEVAQLVRNAVWMEKHSQTEQAKEIDFPAEQIAIVLRWMENKTQEGRFFGHLLRNEYIQKIEGVNFLLKDLLRKYSMGNIID